MIRRLCNKCYTKGLEYADQVRNHTRTCTCRTIDGGSGRMFSADRAWLSIAEPITVIDFRIRNWRMDVDKFGTVCYGITNSLFFM